MNIAVTGHRPNKLWGYDYYHPSYINLGKALKHHITDLGGTHLISGMALGVDTIFALVGLKLRDTNPDIVVECAIPCLGHSKMWRKESVDLYNSIIERSDLVTIVTNQPYNSSCMQTRNVYMVDNCDTLIAVWDGTPGGTANCVQYAKSVGKSIVYINPTEL